MLENTKHIQELLTLILWLAEPKLASITKEVNSVLEVIERDKAGLSVKNKALNSNYRCYINRDRQGKATELVVKDSWKSHSLNLGIVGVNKEVIGF